RVRVAIAAADGQRARAEALRFLQQDAQSPERLRLWALAELRHGQLGSRAAVVDCLVRALELAPAHARPAHAQELAHVALALDDLSDRVHAALAAVRRDQRDLVGEELRLHRIRAALAR